MGKRQKTRAAAKMRGSTEEGSTNFFSTPPHGGYKKNTEFSADIKNAKCTYAKCTYKKLF
jgi:hypothetical protein